MGLTGEKEGFPGGEPMEKGDPFPPLSAHVLAAMLPVPVGGRGHPPAEAGGRNGTCKKVMLMHMKSETHPICNVELTLAKSH